MASETPFNPGSQVSVPSATSTAVVAANRARFELTICNNSDTNIFLRLAATGAVIDSGLRLNANGGSWTTNQYTGAVSAFHNGGAAKLLSVVEI